MAIIERILKPDNRLTVGGVPEGYDAKLLADLATAAQNALGGVPILHIAREDARLRSLQDGIAFFNSEIEILPFPAWDCLPYDRVSPNVEIAARRLATLSWLVSSRARGAGTIVLTTINAVLQRVPPRDWIASADFELTMGNPLDSDALIGFLQSNGYTRASQVTEPGEFAVRGGLIDLYPTGSDKPYRIDLFGDEIDSIRIFDPLDQRTIGRDRSLVLRPVSEVPLDSEAIRRFRQGYVSEFGPANDDDPLYEAVSEGRKYQGMEHWLPLFHASMETLFDYVPSALVTLDHQCEEAGKSRLDSIGDYFQSRKSAQDAPKTALSSPYKPLSADALFLSESEWLDHLDRAGARQFSPYRPPESDSVIVLEATAGRDFATERNRPEINIYDAVRDHIQQSFRSGRRVVVASYSQGARDRLNTVLSDHNVEPIADVEGWSDVLNLPSHTVALAVLPIERGFELPDLALITEQDVLGDRLVRRGRSARRADSFLTEASSISIGDYVVHVEHGVGRFEGLETITVAGAPHDCVNLAYAGGDRLYIPVENIEVLSRYGSDTTSVELDKLGGHAWQARKARMKDRIRDMADKLIEIAASRAMKDAPKLSPQEGLYDEFAARFPYSETEDQRRAIDATIADLTEGQPMDRLICGDVGFGKTEVALRASFIAVMEGQQVAVVTPTTLLARQHLQTFRDRFRGLPVRIEQLSRLVGPSDSKKIRDGLASGAVDIVIGTHALLGKSISFKRLGLLIVDEEQHFGVRHKERLKELRSNVHVLTLTATPIPRTLQLAMSGIRDLSLIATPPVDRLAVRTFVMPFDDMVVREALLREHYRGGQSFYVCPRIADIEEVAEFLKSQVPEIRFVIAHGQMASSRIEEVMTAFYDGRYDVLLSTSIIESGLDIPRANTLVVHRADMFGLAQLYQLRGRVGRSKMRAYAYLTIPANKPLTQGAYKRLEVLQSLDTLGAGFSLASHDLDIRGAGNLLGEEQSGHIREVGVELYQQMLEEAVAEARTGTERDSGDDAWSPQINIGASVLIPEHYVGDLDLRMALYRRLADLDSDEEIEGFAAEMIDRFGPLPQEVEQLFTILRIKLECRHAGIEQLEAGPKGITMSFRNNRFPNPKGLVEFISNQQRTAKLRPDHTLVYLARSDDIKDRLKLALNLARGLGRIAAKADEAA